MGTIYVTSNGGENSNVKPKYIYHAVVAGESRLVNEEDIKSATRKSLHIANKNGFKNIVMMPPDCGTHDINDASRVHLSAIKTYLQTEKECNFKMPPTFAFNLKALYLIKDIKTFYGFEDNMWRDTWCKNCKIGEIDNTENIIWNIHGKNTSTSDFLIKN